MPVRFLLVSVAVASAFAACGDELPIAGSDGGTSDDGAVDDARVTVDGPSPVDASDGAVPPTRAPFGLDVRPPNPTCVAPPRPTADERTVRLTEVFAGIGLDRPMVLAQIPGDRTRFFAAELGGNIVSFAAQNPTTKRVVGRVPGEVFLEGESGLLGMAFHPRFSQNGYVYLSYVRMTTVIESVVIRMQSADNGLTFGNPVTILGPFEQPQVNHKGGDLHFGPDGFLYASFGDGGGQNDVFGNGQRKDSLFSKIVRIDVDSAFPYAIPDGNPFKLGGGEPATYAYGFRNPFRFTVDPVSGNVWALDVGETEWEEIDRVVPGGNYGWNVREGAHCFPPGATCSSAGYVDPYFEYDRTRGSCGIGGPIYRGAKMPELHGSYIGADCVYQHMFALTPDPATGAPVYRELNDFADIHFWVGFAEDLDHELYALTLDSKVYALDRAPRTAPVAFPDRLSKTGCFEATDPKKPVAAMIPYAPTAPFWSDGAEKERFFAIPDSTSVATKQDGDFDFPIGTVLAKHFRVDGRLVETRLFVRHDDGGWGGYSYEWNDAQTDAALLPAEKTRALPANKSWYYPGRGECFSCHSEPAGRSLGLETAQLDADFVYQRTNRISNQLATLEKIGILAGPAPAASTVPRLVEPFGTAPLEARARSYLHTNCSHCHRPLGTGRSMDLQYARTLKQTGACNEAPLGGDLGVAGAKLLVPGSPSTSLVSLRVRSTGPHRMPPVATRLVDTAGAALIDAYVRSLTACPP